MVDIFTAKKRLSEALESKEPEYWDLMKKWYRGKISKDDFDVKARRLLGADISLHNDFLFALLIKCHSGSSTAVVASAPVPRVEPPIPPTPEGVRIQTAPSVRKEKTRAEFIPMPFGREKLPLANPLPSELHLVRCATQHLLPNLHLLHTRMLLDSWEAGMQGATQDAARLLCAAIEQELKTVLTCIVAHRQNWRTRSSSDGFVHSFGRGLLPSAGPLQTSRLEGADGPPKPVGLDQMRRRAEAEEVRARLHSAPDRPPEPITLFEVKDCLQAHRRAIPSSTVYSMTMERLSSVLWHPSSEEIRAAHSVDRWQRDYRRSQQTYTPHTQSS